MFSSNEDKDDLATSDMKYLLIPFYLAEVLTQLSEEHSKTSRKLETIQKASSYYSSFVLMVQQYGFLEESTVLKQNAMVALENKQMDPSTLRESKIERFKLEKSIKNRLKILESINNGLRKQENEEDYISDGDGIEREMHMLRIHAAILKSSESILTLEKEINILRHAATLDDEKKKAQRTQQQTPPELLDQLRAAVATLSMSQASTSRDQLQRQVFKPSHILPTMSVEQWGDQEVSQMLERQQQEQDRAQKASQMQQRMSKDDIEDEELKKQRAWDDFKDDNPRGWGNSKRKPTG